MTILSTSQVVLFQPSERIDSQTGIDFQEKMSQIIPNANQLWVIDLAKVNFMDSTGLVPLVNGLKAARQNGCRLVLCNVQTPVRLVLELTQLDSVFEIYNSYEDAVLTASDSSDASPEKATALTGTF
ncbi:anti-sigma-factor antagonist [Calothrix sp. NIES-4071]|nr:anti-sigma-factor antagonist [Calothrix sp. NIES-4071]BAZ61277.1 anti-sigma-factor antagonist [Calothrix sp. NIES-4105]